ncbi:immunoglobulin-like domain-containing protein [Brochothrix thermosphacta]|uniref:immunoglobulin-like domain-containing protein n=1 Tax=Brochothrix thermosphacta TaxID=2756 RepID=UPI003B848A68
MSTKRPEPPTIKPNPFYENKTGINGKYTGEINHAIAFLNNSAKAKGGTFSNGNFFYYIGSGVTINDKLEIQGYDINSQPVTEKINIEILKATTEEE